jgi:hypothetical protein
VSEQDFFSDAPVLHFGRINNLGPAIYGIQFRSSSSSYVKAVLYDGRILRGIAASLPAGSYTVTVISSTGRAIDAVCDENKNGNFVVGQGESFIPFVGLCGQIAASDSAGLGMEGGYAAGVAISVIVLIAAVALATYYVISRRCTGGYVKADGPAAPMA